MGAARAVDSQKGDRRGLRGANARGPSGHRRREPRCPPPGEFGRHDGRHDGRRAPRKATSRVRPDRRAICPEERKDRRDDTQAAGDSESLALLRSIDSVYVQHQSRLGQRQQLEVQTKEAEKQLQSLDKFDPDEPKPYSFLFLEGLKDQLAVEDDRQQALASDVKSAKQLLQAAHDKLDACENARQEQARNRSETSAKLIPAQLVCTLARADVGLKQATAEVQSLRMDLCKAMQQQLTKKIEKVAKDVAFSADDHDKEMQLLAASEADLKRRRKEAEAHLQEIASGQKDALQELTNQHAPQKVVWIPP